MKYRKKSVVIEAIQYTGKNCRDIKNLFPHIVLYATKSCDTGTSLTPIEFERLPINELYMASREGYERISLGDWVIKNAGVLYVCERDIFEKTYEKVEDNE